MKSNSFAKSNDSLLLFLRNSLGDNDYPAPYNNVNWQGIYELSCQYGVSAIVCDGLNRLTDINIDEELYYKWIGQSMVKDEAFAHHVSVLKEFANRCSEKGVKVYVLKGLAFSTYYPNPKHRPCGDIDVFCVDKDGNPAYREGDEVARAMGAIVDTHWYKHSQIRYKGVTIENHEYLVCTREGKRYKELNRKLTDLLLEDNQPRLLFNTGALIPSCSFNALFQAYHSCAHFLAEGIGLKHVLDWATFLQKEQQNIDWNRFYVDCERYHLKRFIVAMTDIAVHKLGVEITVPEIEVDSPYADKLLDSVLYDDAKVFGTPGGAWNHRVRLIKNVFKYRWKYTEIAQVSFLRHIVVSVWGFFFHTED